MKLLILPSDHLIYPQDLFEKSVINGLEVKKIILLGQSLNLLLLVMDIPHYRANKNKCLRLINLLKNLAKAEEFIKILIFRMLVLYYRQIF